MQCDIFYLQWCVHIISSSASVSVIYRRYSDFHLLCFIIPLAACLAHTQGNRKQGKSYYCHHTHYL